MKNHETITDKINPKVILHTFTVQGTKWAAIDTYGPQLEQHFSDFEKVIGYESALGYRLRWNFEVDEGYYIPPVAIPDDDIIRLLKENIKFLKSLSTPLLIGFYYDAITPNECSAKNTNRVMEFCHKQRLDCLVSTGYTPSTATRKCAANMNGLAIFEHRVPGPMGVSTCTIKQLCYITRRTNYYGGGTDFTLRLGPIMTMPNGKASISPNSFWREAKRLDDSNDKKPIRLNDFVGLKLFVPSPSVVPKEYLNLIEQKQFIKEKAPPLTDAKFIAAIYQSWKEGYGIDIFGNDLGEDENYSSPLLLDGHRNQQRIPSITGEEEFVDHELEMTEDEMTLIDNDYYPIVDNIEEGSVSDTKN